MVLKLFGRGEKNTREQNKNKKNVKQFFFWMILSGAPRLKTVFFFLFFCVRIYKHL